MSPGNRIERLRSVVEVISALCAITIFVLNVIEGKGGDASALASVPGVVSRAVDLLPLPPTSTPSTPQPVPPRPERIANVSSSAVARSGEKVPPRIPPSHKQLVSTIPPPEGHTTDHEAISTPPPPSQIASTPPAPSTNELGSPAERWYELGSLQFSTRYDGKKVVGVPGLDTTALALKPIDGDASCDQVLVRLASGERISLDVGGLVLMRQGNLYRLPMPTLPAAILRAAVSCQARTSGVVTILVYMSQ